MTDKKLKISVESYPLKEAFTISRGSKRSADVVVVEIHQNGLVGRGEAVPYARYGETLETVTASIENIQTALEKNMSRTQLQSAMLPGAARNAIDCALWDLEAQIAGQTLPQYADLPTPKDLPSAFTISLNSPAVMADKAKQAKNYPLLKLKLGGEDGFAADLGRLAAVRQARPEADLMVDVNEAWQANDLAAHVSQLKSFNLKLIEQPLAEGKDDILKTLDLSFCADESIHDTNSLTGLKGKYDWVNIKLDKTGGLTEALKLVDLAKKQGFQIMIGCMVSSSLALYPAFCLAQICDLADLDGALFLAQDRQPGFMYKHAVMSFPTA
ncbi:MAG: N-acetyl-D-Glu racemase DgcA [Parvibaculales bacterium]